jgi:hypothetical protein
MSDLWERGTVCDLRGRKGGKRGREEREGREGGKRARVRRQG